MTDIFDLCQWQEVEIQHHDSTEPYATHTATVNVGDVPLRCYILNDGRRIVNADDVHSLLSSSEDCDVD